jgi:biopolymer transport protein ExbB
MTRDFAEVLKQSPTSMQVPKRTSDLARLSEPESGLNLERMENLWLQVQQEMTLAAQFAQFDAPVVSNDGTIRQQTVVQFGGFSSYQQGQFLRFVPETQELLQVSSTSQETQTNQAFFSNPSDVQTLYVDPSNGSLLGILEWTPDWRERLEQGGIIGKIILALGAVGLLVILWRVLVLGWQNQVIKGQVKQLQNLKSNNPLGRILLRVKESTSNIDISQSNQLDMLQLQVDEAVLHEVGGVERGQNLLKLLAATAPLLGLLGTVTGMIVTFQSISFFGSGDPKLMAGGISQALVTTVLGLIVAIPLLFGHSFISSLSENIIRRLEEQTAGFLAQLVEGQIGNTQAKDGS